MINLTERNYEIHNKEMLVVIRYLEVWKHYLEGAKVQLKIWLDYKNLQYFMTSQKLNHRQARWILYLSRFDFVLRHIPGKSMEKADGLSERPDWQEGVERDNENRTLIKQEWMRKVEMLIGEGNLRERIKKMQERDEKVVKAIKKLKESGVKLLKDKEWSVEEGLVIKKDRIYIPEGSLRVEVIKLYHDMPVGGHRGR